MARLAAGIRKRKDGILEKRFTVNGKRYSVYGKTSKEIGDKEQDLREKLKSGTYTDDRNITLDVYFKEWINRKKGTIKASTVYSYSTYYNHNISPGLGRRKISQLERRELYAFQGELAKQLHPANVNQIFKVLRMILNDAVTDGIIVRNPADGVKALKNEEAAAAETIHRALTETEQETFMRAAAGSYYYEFMAIMILTGMRYGEAAALTWEEVDHKANVIHVVKNRNVLEDGSAGIGTPKTSTSIRDIPITNEVRRILKQQGDKMKLLNGLNVLPFDRRVFSTPGGAIISSQVINRAIERILQQLDEEGVHIDRFTSHAFRDTFATRYIEQGGNPQTLKTILGHKNLSITMDLYSHVLPNTKQKEMDLLRIIV